MKLYNENGIEVGTFINTGSEPKGPRKRIALCIGHNNKAQGAVGEAGISEYHYNKDFIAELLTLLSWHEYKVFERPAISSYNAQQDALHRDIAKWGECDIAVEFHFNAAESDVVNGHEILYLSKGGRNIAIKLDKEWDTYLESNDRGVKQLSSHNNGYGFLRRGSYMSIIVEPFFAAHQNKFINGGSQRESLLRSYVEFFKKI